MKAFVLIRQQPWYRSEAFKLGLKAAGYEVIANRPVKAQPVDVLVIWNRYGDLHQVAKQFEAEGGTVVVAENGYIGAAGVVPKFEAKDGVQEGTYYALAIGGHNGSGRWKVGGPDRFAALGIELAPWQSNDDGHYLVCGQRSIGSPQMASPPDWHEKVAAWLRKRSTRDVRIRPHPGNDTPKRPLSADLRGAYACVIWSSGSGVEALVHGIPVFFEAPNWICEGAARRLNAGESNNPLKDSVARRQALEEMAWAQWTVAELQSGEPFRRLLSR